MRRTSLLLVAAMPIANSALAQECAGGVGDETCCGDLDHSGSVTQADLDIANDPGAPGLTVDKGLNTVDVLVATGSLCTQTMTLRNDTQTPVTVRLSRTGS